MDGISELKGNAMMPPSMEGVNNQAKPAGPGEMPPPMKSDISPLGKLFSKMEQLEESAQSDLKQFHESVLESLKKGQFDAQALADNAPDSVKQAAEDAGIDLYSALKDMSENLPPAPPPPAGGNRPPVDGTEKTAGGN